MMLCCLTADNRGVRFSMIALSISSKRSPLIAILALALLHRRHTGVYTFDYMQLLGTPMAASTAMGIMLGFVVAFVVKLPAVPFHTWLPDAHTEAPTAGSVLLAGLLLKTGAYGLLRFNAALLPAPANEHALWINVL